MLRPIYVFLINCFIGLLVTYFSQFEYVNCHKKFFLPFDKAVAKLSNKKKIHLKQRKKYFFIPKNYLTKINDLSSKSTFFKHHLRRTLQLGSSYGKCSLFKCNSCTSVFKIRKYKLFNNDTQKSGFANGSGEDKEGEVQKEQKEEKQNRIVKREKWKRYLKDRRNKEILKELDSKGGRKRDISRGNVEKKFEEEDEEEDNVDDEDEDGVDDEDEDDEEYYAEGEEDEEHYDEGEYDSENVHSKHFYDNRQEKENLNNNHVKKENEENGKFYDNKRGGFTSSSSSFSSITENINNIFISKKNKDFPLFFPIHNKSYENSNNKYFDKICSIPPNELINRFFENTSDRIKEAVKNIIFNIIGNIQKYTIETSILITYDKLYNFLLQIILTGYMIKNADYRLCLNESLYDKNNIIHKNEDNTVNLKKSFNTLFADTHKKNGGDILNASELGDKNGLNQDNNEEKENGRDILDGKRDECDNGHDNNTHERNVQDINILIRSNSQDYRKNEPNQDIKPYTKCKEIENDDFPIINTKNYILFLRKKIISLENKLKIMKESKTFLNDDLLSYIKSLSDIQLRSLTDNIGTLVLDATKKIVELVIQGMTLNINKNLSNELIYISGSVLTYICFWQLIIGYTLREMEIRDELSDYLRGG
ncbi:conserved Plasmodium protein, unknown function [Plasmodium ovale]|uniref:Uncharacterized protein n=2 Tax=Plasmodium ovale TaxID=36330 RepID=A0A1A8WKJ0_PLAOA|nr:conserved Plasmodium protein, unknown function [Plasmodium ovale curtisi]SBS92376.1 conserved Plasmodium protein, unknown function [Plasmodium ovale curtisi]SCQ16398.1 conserved Plasmodium protein, unknown function [Plasmodium ovale]